VSRYGKAALVTMAFDERFALVLVGSSGEGGAKLHRRNWGEAVENLTGTGEYHWMAGNFLKYGASRRPSAARTRATLPVDAHELLALCAPRLDVHQLRRPEKGDAKWLDHQGSFMAAVAAQAGLPPARREGLGDPTTYKTRRCRRERRLLDGQLAWRQHDGGHTDARTGDISGVGDRFSDARSAAPRSGRYDDAHIPAIPDGSRARARWACSDHPKTGPRLDRTSPHPRSNSLITATTPPTK
jgi:hypothetical protein